MRSFQIFQSAVLSIGLLFSITNANAAGIDPVKPVSFVQLDRYLGKWYEIKSIPAWFQKGCNFTTAEYDLNSNGTLSVKNRCLIDATSADETSKEKIALGRGWIEDTRSNAILKVSFVKLITWVKSFAGDYWILGLGPVNPAGLYSYAIVGTPDRKFGWILAREPKLDPQTLEAAEAEVKAQGYDINLFNTTKQ